MIKPIPFRAHGAVDLLAGLFLVAAPWLLGFAADAAPRNFFLAMGGLTFAVVALTDHTRRLEVPPREPGDRRRWSGPASTG